MTNPNNEGPILGLEQNMGIKAEDVRKRMEELSNQPKILFIGGTHPRHLYYANKIHERYPLAGRIFDVREHMIPQPPNGISRKDAKLWKKHFQGRENAEFNYFPPLNLDVYSYLFHHDLFGSQCMIDIVKEINPDIALIFGCGMIKGELSKVLPELTINLHLGLSPRYRGAATLFWPFYFLEPQWAGCTFHKIVDEPDAGDILHQCVPELKRGDKIHDVACKAVVEATMDMIKLLGMIKKNEKVYLKNITKIGDLGKRKGRKAYELNNKEVPDYPWREEIWKFHPQSTTGKNFLSRDFQPSHLRMIYETYNDDIVDQYLDGNLKQHKPKLVRQF